MRWGHRAGTPCGRRRPRRLPWPSQRKALLAAVPAPPPQATYLGVLGPLTLRRGGPRDPELDDPNLRRTRVKSLLAFLVGHRATTRAAIADALWPDLPRRRSSNNLAVTLNHALRLLEPWRTPGESAYLVRLDGQHVRLVTGEHLHVDVDDFEQHLADAGRAEEDATPSAALGHYLAAVDLYRGLLGTELPDAPWMELDREHYRIPFVTAATRAGQLLLGQGDTDRAEQVARRAIDADPWAEPAHALLVSAALVTGNHSAAHRRLNRCLAMLADLGTEPPTPPDSSNAASMPNRSGPTPDDERFPGRLDRSPGGVGPSPFALVSNHLSLTWLLSRRCSTRCCLPSHPRTHRLPVRPHQAGWYRRRTRTVHALGSQGPPGTYLGDEVDLDHRVPRALDGQVDVARYLLTADAHPWLAVARVR